MDQFAAEFDIYAGAYRQLHLLRLCSNYRIISTGWRIVTTPKPMDQPHEYLRLACRGQHRIGNVQNDWNSDRSYTGTTTMNNRKTLWNEEKNFSILPVEGTTPAVTSSLKIESPQPLHQHWLLGSKDWLYIFL